MTTEVEDWKLPADQYNAAFKIPAKALRYYAEKRKIVRGAAR